ncbi:MAG: MCP four helix bundle domain-containing protein [Fibrobacterota bacterium]
MFKNMKLGLRLAIGFGALLVLMVTVGMIALDRIGQIDEKVHLVVEDRMPKTKAANEWIDAVNSVARILRNGVISGDAKFISKEFERISGEREKIDKSLKYLEESIKSKEGKEVLAVADDLRLPVRESQEKIIAFAMDNNDSAAANLLFGEYRELQSKYLAALSALCEFQEKLAQADGEEAAELGNSTRKLVIALLGFAAFLALFIAWLVTRSITKPINECMAIAEKVARGETDLTIVSDCTDETGLLMASMKRMVDTINTLVAQMKRMSEEHNKGDIDVAMAPEKFEGAFRSMASGVNDMVFGHIAVKKKAMACVKSFGEGDFDAPLEKFPGKKVFINDTIEQVRTNLKALIADATMLSKAAVEGRLSTRADASKHQGDFRKIVAGVNDTLDAVIGPLNVAAKYVDDISKGNIPARITDTYNGDFNTLKNNLNTCVEAVNALVADAGLLVKAAVEGRLQTRADASKHNGDFRKIVQGVN